MSRFCYNQVAGVKIPLHFSRDNVLLAIQYVPRAGDIIIDTYPKCGTTWVQCIVYLILTKCRKPMNVEDVLASIPYLERDGLATQKGTPFQPLALKYHLPFDLVPYSPDAKYIYVARNPLDTCVSLYHHFKIIPSYDFHNGSFDDFFEAYLTGDIPFGGYIDHLLSWYKHRFCPNVLFLTYEDMKADPSAAVLKIASFLGENSVCEDKDLLEAIVKYSSLDYMKQHINNGFRSYLMTVPNADYKNSLKYKKIEEKYCDEKKAANIVRKGEIGDWQNFFSFSQKKRLINHWTERTKGTGVADLWSDLLYS